MAKENQAILEKLWSSKSETILNGIDMVRKSGEVAYIKHLAELYKHEDAEIDRKTTALLNDIKKKEAIPVFMDMVTNDEYTFCRDKLLSAMWNNGLDYSPYLMELSDIAIQGDYKTSLEAVTVIENLPSVISESQKSKSITYLKSNLSEVSAEKKRLLHELIHIIENHIPPKYF